MFLLKSRNQLSEPVNIILIFIKMFINDSFLSLSAIGDFTEIMKQECYKVAYHLIVETSQRMHPRSNCKPHLPDQWFVILAVQEHLGNDIICHKINHNKVLDKLVIFTDRRGRSVGKTRLPFLCKPFSQIPIIFLIILPSMRPTLSAVCYSFITHLYVISPYC
jgi:hypothetical protein